MNEIVGWLIKVAPACGGAAAMYLGPRLWRAWKNRSKTEEQIALEKLDEALKAAAVAHATPDPGDDGPADALVAARKDAARRARLWAATVDGFADEE